MVPLNEIIRGPGAELTDLVSAVVLTYAAQSLIACGIALALSRLVRRPVERELLWKGALAGPAFTTAVTVMWWRTGHHGALDLSMALRRTWRWHLPGREVTARIFEVDGARQTIGQIVDPVAATLSTAIVALAVLGIGVASIHLIRRRRRLAQSLSRRERLDDERTATELAGHLLPRTVRLSTCGNLASPIACSNAEICIPGSVLADFTTEQRCTLMAHELAHLERRDPFWLLAFDVIVALSAFQPLVFRVRRAMRRDVEFICDERAARSTGDKQALIASLARLAAPFDADALIHGAATAYDGSPLLARAERIAGLDLVDRPRRARRIAIAVAVATLLGLSSVPAISSAPAIPDLLGAPEHPPDAFPGRRILIIRESRPGTMDSAVVRYRLGTPVIRQ